MGVCLEFVKFWSLVKVLVNSFEGFGSDDDEFVSFWNFYVDCIEVVEFVVGEFLLCSDEDFGVSWNSGFMDDDVVELIKFVFVIKIGDYVEVFLMLVFSVVVEGGLWFC